MLVPPMSLGLQLGPIVRKLPFLQLLAPLIDLLLPLLLEPIDHVVANHDDGIVLRRMRRVRIILFGGDEVLARILGSSVGRFVAAALEEPRNRLCHSTGGGPTATDGVRHAETVLPCFGSELVGVVERAFFDFVVVIWCPTDIGLGIIPKKMYLA